MDLYRVRNLLNQGKSIRDINLRVVEYARVSTDHEEQKKSLINQVEHFREYIDDNPNWIYSGKYIDEAVSGTTDIKRDDFMKMINDAKMGMFDLIVTKEISRFSRNTLDSIKYTRKLLSYGVGVLFTSDNINTFLPDSELRLTIMASMAQDEVRRLSERIKFGMKRSIKKGDLLGGNNLFGYIKKNRRLIVNEREAKIIEKIYRLYAVDKLSLSEIAKTLNEEISNKKFYSTTIARIIENPKYKGYYCGGKTEVIDYITKEVKKISKEQWTIYPETSKVPAIVSEELWKMANDRLEERKRNKKRSKENYLYTSKIYCQFNHPYYRRKLKNNKITWICSKHLNNGSQTCSEPSLREDELNQILVDMIKEIIDGDKLKRTLTSFYKRNYENRIVNDSKDIKKSLGIITDKNNKLLELLLNDDITKEEFDLARDKLRVKEKHLNNKLRRIEKSESSVNDIADEIDKIINDDTTYVGLIKDIVNKIIVKRDNDDIVLDIYMLNNSQNKLVKTYSFKRGFDVVGTRRYIVTYRVVFNY